MPPTPLLRQAGEALRCAVHYLLCNQARDGFWRDYCIKEVTSEGWTTAWVGWCLSPWASDPKVRSGLNRATRAILDVATPGGWGYNRQSVADADSTSWAIAFLAARGFRCKDIATAMLPKFISPAGSVRTFLDPTRGTWSDVHVDVASLAGLALLAARALPELQRRVRRALLNAAKSGGTWQSFWWASDIYATVWAGIFLNRSGGISQTHASRLSSWLQAVIASSALERALVLLLLSDLGHDTCSCARLVTDLLDQQMSSGAWPSSPLLLIPARHAGDTAYPVGPHSDVNGFVTTALTAIAILSWQTKSKAITH